MGTQSVTVTTSTPTTPPSWIKYYNMSSSSTLNVIRNITSTIWSIRTRHQASRVLRTTHLLLRCFLFFDICYLLSGISLIVMALTEQFANKEKMILFGGLFGVFASVSALCNSKSWSENLEARLPHTLAGILLHVDGVSTHGAGPLPVL